MACDGSSRDDFPDKVMPRPPPCTCNKKCKNRSSSVVFLGLFLLSLALHAITLVCYLDLRSEVKREIFHQKRDSMLTLGGTDLADPAFSPGHQRGDSGSRGEGHEVKHQNKNTIKSTGRGSQAVLLSQPSRAESKRRRHCFHSSQGGCSCSFTSEHFSCSVSRCQICCLLCYGMFQGKLFYGSLSWVLPARFPHKYFLNYCSRVRHIASWTEMRHDNL